MKARAAESGESFNTYLKRLLRQEAEKPTQNEVFQRIAARSERSPVSSTEFIRAEREVRDAGNLRR